MMPLGFRENPSPNSRLRMHAAHEGADQTGSEGHSPVDPAAGPPEDDLGRRTNEHADEDDGEDDHDAAP